MAGIQKVTVAGATGKVLGPVVVQALVSAGFMVSCLTRSSSQSQAEPLSSTPFPAGVKIVTTDHSTDSLRSVLKGQDAVVSCVGFGGVLGQLALIDTAATVGVQRFVPSEFGNNPFAGAIPELEKFTAAKRRVLEHLQEVAGGNGGFSWNAVADGPFLPWVLTQGSFGFSLSTRTATIYDSGNEPFTGTLLSEVGACVIRLLQIDAHESCNKLFCVRSLRLTQNELLAAFETATDQPRTVTHQRTKDVLERGSQRLAKGDASARGDLLVGQFFEDRCGRGVVAKSAEDGEEGMRVLGVKEVDIATVVQAVIMDG